MNNILENERKINQSINEELNRIINDKSHILNEKLKIKEEEQNNIREAMKELNKLKEVSDGYQNLTPPSPENI